MIYWQAFRLVTTVREVLEQYRDHCEHLESRIRLVQTSRILYSPRASLSTLLRPLPLSTAATAGGWAATAGGREE